MTLSVWLVSSPREGPSELGEFQGLPEAISSCLPSGLKASLQNGIFQSQGNYDTPLVITPQVSNCTFIKFSRNTHDTKKFFLERLMLAS